MGNTKVQPNLQIFKTYAVLLGVGFQPTKRIQGFFRLTSGEVLNMKLFR
ncbi:hypothetical protein GXM_03485 [Nostoc sphaeroides CCNUC1]|uniref:Uncharacterized protein n=1 Tax=Nostoc sphaeroides CCNUC1 TaxID=2653204 RepID=A0A5P8VZW8_9NOSO|nr:hypothetical protein GXM_03485 [Nostoc sphaeroides CCNUC1]